MKSKTKLSTAILIGSAVIGATNCEAQVEKKFSIIKKDSIEFEKRLKKLAKTEYKKDISSGAMCYAVAETVEEEYICPICGKKTIRTNYDIWNIKNVSKAFNEIRSIGYDVVLDQIEYCQYCSIDKYVNKDDINSEVDKTTFTFENNRIKEPSIIFKIRFSQNAKYHVVKSNIDEDYIILLEFLKGEDTYLESGLDIKPIHWKIDVIKKMTGLGKDIITHKHYYVHGDEKAYHKNEFKKVLKKMGESEERMHWYEQ